VLLSRQETTARLGIICSILLLLSNGYLRRIQDIVMFRISFAYHLSEQVVGEKDGIVIRARRKGLSMMLDRARYSVHR
jgi:hypothetical protein